MSSEGASGVKALRTDIGWFGPGLLPTSTKTQSNTIIDTYVTDFFNVVYFFKIIFIKNFSRKNVYDAYIAWFDCIVIFIQVCENCLQINHQSYLKSLVVLRKLGLFL